jgi:hypothetical protein
MDVGTDTKMTPEEYIENRLQKQADWHSGKSAWNQGLYKRLRFAEMICATLIPAIAGFASDFSAIKYFIVILGIATVILSAAQSIWRFQENWLSYRQTTERLIQERYFWETKSGPYAEAQKPDPFQSLVERTEGIITHEVSDWKERMQQEK